MIYFSRIYDLYVDTNYCVLNMLYRILGHGEVCVCCVDAPSEYAHQGAVAQGLSAGESPDHALEEEAREQLAAGTLNSMVCTLQSREANILRLRFGLNSERRQLPRSEIAAAYGLSGERIRQIEEAALHKLAKPWRRQFVEQAMEDLQ